MPDKILSFDEYLAAKNSGLDPLTMQPVKTKQSSIKPLDYLGTTPSPVSDLDELYTYSKRDIPVYSTSNVEDLQEGRAESQGISEVFGNASGRYVAGLIPEIIGSVGAVLDSPREIASWFGYEGEMGNALTRLADEAKQTVDEDWFPIYRSKDRTFMDVGDLEWWIENGSSIQRSAVGFMATGVGVGAVFKGLGALGKGTALLEAIGMAPTTAARVAGGTETLATAFMLNHAEGVMEATEVYNNVYQSALQRGYSEEEAKLKASEGASATVAANRINILFNLTSASKFLKPLGSSKELLERGWKSTAKDFLKEGIQEAAEESVNLLASEYGTRVGMGAESGLTTSGGLSTFMRGTDKLATGEGAEAAFLGFLGGTAQTGMQNLANKSKYNPLTRRKDADGNWISQDKYMRQMYENQQELLKQYKEMGLPENSEKKMNVFQEVQEKIKNDIEIAKALDEKNETKVQELLQRDFGYRIAQAINMGTMEQLLEAVDDLAKVEVAKAESEGKSTKGIMQKAQEAKQLAEFLEKRWANNEILINRLKIDGDPEAVAQFKRSLKFKANNLNSDMFLNKKYTEEQVNNLAQEEAEGFNPDYLKGIVTPYVRKQAAELDKKGKEYADLLNPQTVQERFKEFLKEKKEYEDEIIKDKSEDVKLDNEIEVFKQAVTDAGYSQKADENITDLPGIGRLRGVNVVFDGNLYRLTREGDNSLKLVGVENGIQIPFTREFLKENISKLKVVDTETVKRDAILKRQKTFKEAQIQAIDQILKNYDSKKEKIQEQLKVYEEKFLEVSDKISSLKEKLKTDIKTKEKRSLKSEIASLKEVLKENNKLADELRESFANLSDAQSQLMGLREFYENSLQNPDEMFINPTDIKNQLQEQLSANEKVQKERKILNESIEDITDSIAFVEKSLDKLNKQKEDLEKVIESLKQAEQDTEKKYKTLSKVISDISDFEQRHKTFTEELRLKQEASDLQKSINMIDLHIDALKKRAEKIYTKPEGYQENPAEGSDVVPEDSVEDEVYNQKKTTSMFTTTGMNVLFDTKRIADTYDAEGNPVLNDNILENNWFERLDLEGIKESEALEVIKYVPDTTDDKQKVINKIIKDRLGNDYVPSESDTLVMIVKDGKPVQYKDKPLVAVLSLPTSVFKDDTFKGSRYNITGILQSYAASANMPLVYNPKNDFFKLGDKTYRLNKPDVQEKIVKFLRTKYSENIKALKAGDILEIQETTLGSPLRKKKWENGKLVNDFRPFNRVFSNEFKLATPETPQNFTIEVVVPAPNETKGSFEFNGKLYTAPAGTAVIMNKNRFKFLYNRTLNSNEVNTVLNLLTMNQDAQIKLPDDKYMTVAGDKVTSLPVFPYGKAVKGKTVPVSILSSLVNYGVKDIKNASLNDMDFYRSKGEIIYKDNGILKTIKVSDLLNDSLNKDFKNFLSKKRITINKNLVNNRGLYFSLELTRNDKNEFIPKWTSHKSYAAYLLNDTAVTNAYVTPAGQSIASINVEVKTDNSGNLVVNQKELKPIQNIPVIESIVEDSFEEMELPPNPVEIDTPKGKRMEFPKNPLARFRVMKLKNFPDGLYKLEENIVDNTNPAAPLQKDVITTYFVKKEGLFLPAPKGYKSLSFEELEVLKGYGEFTLKEMVNEENNIQSSFTIQGYASPKQTKVESKIKSEPQSTSTNTQEVDIEQAPEATSDMFEDEETIPVAQIFSDAEVVVNTIEDSDDWDSLISSGTVETTQAENINTVNEEVREDLLTKLQVALKTAPFKQKAPISKLIRELENSTEITDSMIKAIQEVCG